MKVKELFKTLDLSTTVKIVGLKCLERQIDVPYFQGNFDQYKTISMDSPLKDAEIIEFRTQEGDLALLIEDNFELYRKDLKREDQKLNRVRRVKKMLPFIEIKSIEELDNIFDDEILFVEEVDYQDTTKTINISCTLKDHRDIIEKALTLYHSRVFTTINTYYTKEESEILELASDVYWIVEEASGFKYDYILDRLKSKKIEISRKGF